MNEFLAGAIVMCCVVVGLYFFRFWRSTHDRLFAFFGISFWLLGLNFVLLAFSDQASEVRPYFYVVRLVAFLVLAAGIIDKNRAGTG